MRELIAKLQKNHDDFCEATNKDVGALKGNFKWTEDQISMIKKMLRKNDASAGAGGDKNKSGNDNKSDWDKIIKQLQADLHLHVQNTEKNFNSVHIEMDNKATK